MKAIVCGYIATYPVGGVVWDYGQYVLALEDLGYEVFYLEDSGQAVASETGDIGAALAFLDDSLTSLSPGMKDRWHYRDCYGTTYGMSRDALQRILKTADLFLNVSGACLLRKEYLDTANKMFVDTDPGSNHFDRFLAVEAWQALQNDPPVLNYRSHDHHFTYAANLGTAGCELPDMGLAWHTTRPPVITRLWSPSLPGTTWTTVMNWNNYGSPIEYAGRIYGAKEMEFVRIEELPTLARWPLEVAVDARRAPASHWRTRGWLIADAATVSRDSASYQHYVSSSRGEFSVAKNVYAATWSGWFSCRSTCYLASGRPVVVQDTGFGTDVPVGHGILAFNELAEAHGALEEVESGYADHSEAARWLAEEYFEGKAVLAKMLQAAGLTG